MSGIDACNWKMSINVDGDGWILCGRPATSWWLFHAVSGSMFMKPRCAEHPPRLLASREGYVEELDRDAAECAAVLTS